MHETAVYELMAKTGRKADESRSQCVSESQDRNRRKLDYSLPLWRCTSSILLWDSKGQTDGKGGCFEFHSLVCSAACHRVHATGRNRCSKSRGKERDVGENDVVFPCVCVCVCVGYTARVSGDESQPSKGKREANAMTSNSASGSSERL